MYATPNCLCSIFRGTTVDEYGDEIDDTTTPIASKVAALITVTSSRTQTQAEQTPRTVQRVTGFVGSQVDVRARDVLRDDRHGVLYAVDSVTQPNGIGRTPDLELELTRLT